MRNVYVCLGCAAHYLPPESMRYEAVDLDASTVHCANPRCATAVEALARGIGITEQQLAELVGRDPAPEPEQPRPVRRVPGKRAPSGPRIARTKLL